MKRQRLIVPRGHTSRWRPLALFPPLPPRECRGEGVRCSKLLAKHYKFERTLTLTLSRRERGQEASFTKNLCNTVVLFSIATIAMSALATPGCSPRRYADAVSFSATHPFRVEPWTNEKDGVVLNTRHYAIHTTITDPQYQHALTQVMEGAYQRYRALAPSTRDERPPLRCYVFSGRQEWETFTTKLAPSDAASYFRINHGGYTIGDQVAVFSSGQSATCASMAHEGWHQYAARHCVDRLPPFLEEGLACLFENVRIDERGQPV